MDIDYGVIKKWRQYFSGRKVYVDIATLNDLWNRVKHSQVPSEKYVKSAIETLVFKMDDFYNGFYLNAGEFLEETTLDRGIVTPMYNLTTTYRLTSSEPCIHNFNVDLACSIVKPGRKIVSIDYKHQEPWIIANMSGDKELKEMASEFDFYTAILDRFGVDVTESSRKVMKVVWNAAIYGSSFESLDSGEIVGLDKIHSWIRNNESIKYMRKRIRKDMNTKDKVFSKFGQSRSYMSSQATHVGFNSVIQMTGADMMYLTLETILSAVNSESYEDKIEIMIPNHDEIVLAVDDDVDMDVVMGLLDGVRVHGWTKPQFTYSVGESWGDCK